MEKNGKVISASEAAELAGMTSRRITGMCREGKIDGAFRKGRNWMIPVSSFKRYLEESGRTGTNETEEHDSVKPLAIGNTSYAEVSSECYYVDKTLLIRDLIDDRSTVTLFTRPRRFGKTLALNMIKTYFEKTDEDTSRYFRDRKIWQCGEKYRSYQGKYPVIMLTFKDVKYDSWEDTRESLRLVIADEFKRHTELSGEYAENAAEYAERLENGTLSDVELSRTLMNLTKLLAEYHDSKTVILIDEYDTPIQQGYTRGFSGEVISFMRNFLSGGLKDNPYLAFGVLTGITRVSKENLFSGLNNPVVNTVLEKKYSTYFGFTEQEVQDMAAYYHETDKTDEIRFWYDGYLFGDTRIYNPWSVANYFAGGCAAKPYWANTSENEIIREILSGLTPEIAEELEKVMQNEAVHASLDMEVVYPQISDGNDTVFSFLMMAGYLTPIGMPEETEIGTIALLRLPNAEVRRIFNTEILSWIRNGQASGVIPEIEKAVYSSDGKRLEEALRKYMISSISYYDGAAEGFYHGMMLGLIASLSSRYYIRSNRESGDGRFDIQMEPKTGNLPGILMEFKASSEKEKLSELAENALKQITEKEYYRELEHRGVRNIVMYGISFSGKDVFVKLSR